MGDKTFFYPNSCHVCKKWNVSLMSCAKCKMISYCSEKHQEEHLPQHKDICAVIKLVLEDKEYMNTEEISTLEWMEIRNMYLTKVSTALKRELTTDENHMFQFPKTCVVCHRQDTAIRCNYCPTAAFCDKHTDQSEHREKYCKLMRESFEIQNRWDDLTRNIDLFYVHRVSDKPPFYDMNSFLDIYVPLDKNDIYLRMVHSYEVTYMLTVYFCIQKLDYLKCNKLSIHIMGTRVACIEDVEQWKMLLALIPNLTTLTITLIQPRNTLHRLSDMSMKIVNGSEIKKLVINVRYMSYEEYVDTTDFTKPNFIVGFDAIFICSKSVANKFAYASVKSGRALAKQKCPCILVFTYMLQIEKQIVNTIENHFFGINPFMMLIPVRHFAEPIYQRYKYLIIFNDLDSGNVVPNEENECNLFFRPPLE